MPRMIDQGGTDDYRESPEAARAAIIWKMIVKSNEELPDQIQQINVALSRGLFDPNVSITSVWPLLA